MKRTTDSHPFKVAEDMADIKHQLKDVTGSLALITPVLLKLSRCITIKNPHIMAKASTEGFSPIGKRLRQLNIPTRTYDIIMESLRTGTKFATARDKNSIHPIVAEVIEFFTHLYDSVSS